MKKLNEINDFGKWDETLFLWTSSGKFVGLCKNEQNILMAAIAYKHDIKYVSKGFSSYRIELNRSTIKGNSEYYYRLYSKYIYFIPQNLKKVYMNSITPTTMKRNKWVTVVILSKIQRIVFDFKTFSYFELNIMPKEKVTLTIANEDEMNKFGLSKHNEPLVKITLPIPFPRDLFIKKVNGIIMNKNDNRYGLVISSNPDLQTEYFKKSLVKNVIPILEKKRIVFAKNKLYKEIMKTNSK